MQAAVQGDALCCEVQFRRALCRVRAGLLGNLLLQKWRPHSGVERSLAPSGNWRQWSIGDWHGAAGEGVGWGRASGRAKGAHPAGKHVALPGRELTEEVQKP